MCFIEPYSVPGPRRISPPVRPSTSRMIPYPCRSPSAKANRICNTAGVRGNNELGSRTSSSNGITLASSLYLLQIYRISIHYLNKDHVSRHDAINRGAFAKKLASSGGLLTTRVLRKVTSFREDPFSAARE